MPVSSPPGSPTVLLADDHPGIRATVREALTAAHWRVVAEAASAEEAISAALAQHPDVCLLDIRMPGGGITAASAIVKELPGTAVVMLTVSRDDDDLFASLIAGARGYLLKDVDPARLPQALQAVCAGEAALPRGLVSRLVEEFRERDRRTRRSGNPALARLTEREWGVLQLLHGGATTSSIAERFVVSPVTVRTHVSSILRKLQVPDRASALRLLDRE